MSFGRGGRLALGLMLAVAAGGREARGAEGEFLYRASLVQAAPGKLLELIDLYKANWAEGPAAGDEAPLWMRHSQGDRWDLLLLFPMGSFSAYYAPERVARRKAKTSAALAAKIHDAIAREEDVFVYGPSLEEVRGRSAKAAFFHVEMFEALAGRQSDLRREREMENAYLKALGRPANLVFVRDSGAGWDLFTIGFYRDIKHYAESADIPEAAQEAAAKAAGFEDAKHIGPYLRTLISSHHDTLAVAIK